MTKRIIIAGSRDFNNYSLLVSAMYGLLKMEMISGVEIEIVSGTTAVSSIKNNRNWILSEIAQEYIPIIEARIKAATKEDAPIKEEALLAQLSLFD